MLLRKIHRDALEYVNRVRLMEGKDPIADFPMGLRHDDANSPLGKVISFSRLDADEAKDDIDNLLNLIAGGTAESAELWYILFCAGFYPRYNEGRFYVRLPLKRRQRLLRTVREVVTIAPTEVKERYLRTKAIVDHVRKQLPSPT